MLLTSSLLTSLRASSSCRLRKAAGSLRQSLGTLTLVIGVMSGVVLGASACVPGSLQDPVGGNGGARAGGAAGSRSGGAVATAGGTGGAAGTGGNGGASAAAAPVPTHVRIEPAGAGFVGTQMVILQPPTAGAVIHYTVDGTIPSRSSPVYSAPIVLRETAIVRAFAEGMPGADLPINAAVFVRLEDTASGFSSNLPVLVLHTQQSGVLSIPEAPMVNASASLFEPRNGKATLLGTSSLTSRIGLRVHGKSSRMFPQKSYSIELRQAGADEDDDTRGLLGLSPDADFILVAPSLMDRSLVRTALAFSLSNEIGQYAARTRFVEVFLTEKNAAPIAARDYIGVYALVEKIKRGTDRVRVERIAADVQTPPAVTGGYVFRVDHDVNDFNVAGTNFGFVYPESEEFLGTHRKAQRAYLQNYVQEFSDSLAQADFKNPKTGLHYAKYIDVASFIDNNLLNALFKNVDAFRFSSYFHKDRDGLMKAGPLWDVDRSSGTTYDQGERALRPDEWSRADSSHPLTYGWWGRLFADPTFKTAHAKRFADLSKGPFSVTRIHALIDKFSGELREAQARHFARWPDIPPAGGHEGEIRALKTWFAARVPWMASQLVP
jgi:hypothetical protein